jgi:hypothetical protein
MKADLETKIDHSFMACYAMQSRREQQVLPVLPARARTHVQRYRSSKLWLPTIIHTDRQWLDELA